MEQIKTPADTHRMCSEMWNGDDWGLLYTDFQLDPSMNYKIHVHVMNQGEDCLTGREMAGETEERRPQES